MLKVKLLDPKAKAPTVENPGEDLGFDLYALEDTMLYPNKPTRVRTGIAAEAQFQTPHGFLVRDRSSMAAKGIITTGGVIDAGYRGEIQVIMTLLGSTTVYLVRAGDKIAQMVPLAVKTGFGMEVVEELSDATRGASGFGSSGK